MCKCKETVETPSGCGCVSWKTYLLIGFLITVGLGAYFLKKGSLPE